MTHGQQLCSPGANGLDTDRIKMHRLYMLIDRRYSLCHLLACPTATLCALAARQGAKAHTGEHWTLGRWVGWGAERQIVKPYAVQESYAMWVLDLKSAERNTLLRSSVVAH